MNIEEIKAAIRRLSLEERAQVAATLHSWTDDAWDAQMKRDLAEGKLDGVVARAEIPAPPKIP